MDWLGLSYPRNIEKRNKEKLVACHQVRQHKHNRSPGKTAEAQRKGKKNLKIMNKKKKSSNVMKDVNLHTKNLSKLPSRQNQRQPRVDTSRTKPRKTNTRNLERGKSRAMSHTRGLHSWLPIKTREAGRQGGNIVKVLKEKNCHVRIPYQAKLSFRKGEIKTFQDWQKTKWICW